ncbi:hypothetical protein CAOG_08868 [Capsaspora owczarzaki ATCC 30864]|uniref:hypothetical protein n=1 Tax=Capsaspora owczarzaki (strain ATCC 30864) TaxID=595528 RepID=UPI0003526E4C|nr:hypothetical protein CAOG_08868 [Capsaspora owczarzaki ATCC 30864]|eukprot:XP_011270523.1 hypothetical protein CAOG_08868 [Capsaspora owczarzaki ATCC 30864]
MASIKRCMATLPTLMPKGSTVHLNTPRCVLNAVALMESSSASRIQLKALETSSLQKIVMPAIDSMISSTVGRSWTSDRIFALGPRRSNTTRLMIFFSGSSFTNSTDDGFVAPGAGTILPVRRPLSMISSSAARSSSLYLVRRYGVSTSPLANRSFTSSGPRLGGYLSAAAGSNKAANSRNASGMAFGSNGCCGDAFSPTSNAALSAS